MKKVLALILALALCAALAVPAFAADAYGPITILDGNSVITFNEARWVNKAIMLSRQTWVEGSAVPATSESMRTNLDLIAVKPGSTVTRSAGGALSLSFLDKSGSGYVLTADRLSLYSTSFTADLLFAYPFASSEICRLTLSDATDYYITSDAVAITEAPPIPIAYNVRAGDNLENIALNYYGVQGLGSYLESANPEHFEATGGILEAGRDLILPVTLNGVPRLAAPLAEERELIYIVKAGDTLASISQRFYGRSDFVNYIYQRNTSRITNSSVIRVGQILVLPVITI